MMKRKRSFDEESFSKFLKENYQKLNENWQDEDNIWAACCTSVDFANQSKNRKLLYTRWTTNYSGIRNQIEKEKSEEELAAKSCHDESCIEENIISSHSKSEIEKMMTPSYAMLQCSNCSVFFVFSAAIYDQCPLIDYLCPHCSLSSSAYQKRTKSDKITVDSVGDSGTSSVGGINEKVRNMDHGYCEENKSTMASFNNFVNEVTIETSNSAGKTSSSNFPNKKEDCEESKLKNEHVIYISDTEKSKSGTRQRISESGKVSLECDQVVTNCYRFILSHSHWNQLNNCKGKDFNFMCGSIFTQYFSEFDLGCNLSYRQCVINRENLGEGRKYISITGICKKDFCAKYVFTIDKPPKPDENIVVNISQIGSICHDTIINTMTSVTKNDNCIISVEETPKFLHSNQYENAEISVQDGNPSIPVQYSSSYYDTGTQDECEKSSDEDNSSYCSEEDLVDEAQVFGMPDLDYSSHNQFTLDYKDWEKIMPSFDEQKLKNGWEEIFAQYFHQFDLGCILEFAYCKLRKPFSMDNSVYLTTYAKCHYENCSTFLFNITHKPIKGEIVIVDVYQQGCVSHKIDVEMASDFGSPNKRVMHTQHGDEEVYYTVDSIPEDSKNQLDLDVSHVITVETSREENKLELKTELQSSDSETDDDSLRILPYELNNEGKMLDSIIRKFEISYEDWLKVKPLKHCKTLQAGWTDLFFHYFASLNLGCILAFSYCYANKQQGAGRKGTNYLRIKSLCKYTGCCKYYFHMKREPKAGNNAKINVIQVGTISHRDGEVKARFIRGKNRKELAKQLENTSAFEFYNKNRAFLAESGYDSTRKKSLNVLRNIKRKKKKTPPGAVSSELVETSNVDNIITKLDGRRYHCPC